MKHAQPTIALIADAWHPTKNGVVTYMTELIRQLDKRQIRTFVFHPGQHRTIPVPRYKEYRLSVYPIAFRDRLFRYDPDYVHILTEGPFGLVARNLAVKYDIPHTTSMHTQFAEIFNAYYKLPLDTGYRFLKWFHTKAATTIVQSQSQQDQMSAKGFKNLSLVGGGVDIERFRPVPRTQNSNTLLYVGRVSYEKGLKDFLNISHPFRKIVVGEGPALNYLRKHYPQVEFPGYKTGDELVAYYANADCFVLPSRAETFGLVAVEAMACGTPVAAFPTMGVKDIVKPGVSGCVHDDLAVAIDKALKVSRASCRRDAESYRWEVVCDKFLDAIAGSEIGQPLRATGFMSNAKLVEFRRKVSKKLSHSH